ncbi:MAG: hypothetical protein RL417_1809 [Pseudomonadota bacterium]|jgi:hypothetical protein
MRLAPISHLFRALLVASLVSTSGCGGGGGGGDDFFGAAIVDIGASPRDIDTGDRMVVRAFLSSVNDDGLMLKFRFPKELRYVLDSARLIVDEDDRDATPQVSVTVDNDSFLVFFLAQSDFNDDANGMVEFQLEADDELSNGEVEVDPDVDDPLIDDDTEFDPENPEFGAEAAVSISVRD